MESELKGLAIAVLLAALIAGLVTAYTRGYDNGRNAVVASDSAALAKADAANAAQAAKNSADVAAVEQKYDSQITTLNGQLADSIQPVRLCVARRVSAVPQAAAGSGKPASTTPAPGSVQPVPAADSSVRAGGSGGPDIGRLLEGLAVAADEVSARLAAMQSLPR